MKVITMRRTRIFVGTRKVRADINNFTLRKYEGYMPSGQAGRQKSYCLTKF